MKSKTGWLIAVVLILNQVFGQDKALLTPSSESYSLEGYSPKIILLLDRIIVVDWEGDPDSLLVLVSRDDAPVSAKIYDITDLNQKVIIPIGGGNFRDCRILARVWDSYGYWGAAIWGDYCRSKKSPRKKQPPKSWGRYRLTREGADVTYHMPNGGGFNLGYEIELGPRDLFSIHASMDSLFGFLRPYVREDIGAKDTEASLRARLPWGFGVSILGKQYKSPDDHYLYSGNGGRMRSESFRLIQGSKRISDFSFYYRKFLYNLNFEGWDFDPVVKKGFMYGVSFSRRFGDFSFSAEHNWNENLPTFEFLRRPIRSRVGIKWKWIGAECKKRFGIKGIIFGIVLSHSMDD